MTTVRYGEDRLRYGDGTVYRGPRAETPDGAAGVALPRRRGVVLRFYDAAGLLFHQVGSDSGGHLVKGQWELLPSGCGGGSWTLTERPAGLTHGTRADLHLWGASEPLWSGWVQEVPAPGRWAWPYEYRAAGWAAQLDWPMIQDEAVAGQTVASVVDDLVRRYVEPRTGIVYAAGAISPLARYRVRDLRLQYVSARQAFEQLAGLAGAYEWGVGADRAFFFRPEVATTTNHWWAGRHCQVASAEEDSSRLLNRVWVQHGRRGTEGDQYLPVPLEDVASQRLHGVREGVVRAPSVYSPADAYRYASLDLARRATPTVRVPVRGVTYDGTPILCRGAARVVSADGAAEYVLRKSRVLYRLDAEGLQVDVDLGARPLDAPWWMSELVATQQRLELTQQAAQRQIAL